MKQVLRAAKTPPVGFPFLFGLFFNETMDRYVSRDKMKVVAEYTAPC